MAETELLTFLKKQSDAYEALLAKFNEEKENKPENDMQRLKDSVAKSITEFVYDPQNGVIFNKWYARYEDTFSIDGEKLDDAAKVRILLRKLDSSSHSKYIDYILPKKPSEVTFEETIKTLKVMFGEPDSLFSIRYNCLKLMKKQSDDYITFASVVNKDCERFKFNDLTLDQFKCLIFICGLQASDKDIRTRLLTKLESMADITLPKLTAECKRLLDLKSDSDLITPKSSTSLVPQVSKISKKSNQSKPSVQPNTNAHNSDKNKPPKRPCWLCGDIHWVKDCPYVKRTCKDCGKIGHKEGFCGYDRSKQAKSNPNPKKATYRSHGLFATSKKEIASRRKFICIKINNRQVKLQVDTASDITVISMELYDFLGRPSSVQCTELANSASGHRMSLKFEFDCQIIANGMEAPVTVYVSDTPNLNLFGLDCLHLFGLMDVPLNAVCARIQQRPEDNNQQKLIESLQQKFSSVFNSSVGTCTKTKAVLRLKPDAKPVFRPSRPVPYAALPIVEAELERLTSEGVLSPVTAEMVQKCSQEDVVLSNVMKYLQTSWPTYIENEEEKILYNRRESLAEINGCLLFNDRVIVPSLLRTKVLNHLHVAHPGIVRMKALARSYVYWPNIDKDVTDCVQKCSRCASAARAPVKSELHSWPKAKQVWSRIHIDYAGPFQGHNFLVIVDSFSKWPEIFVMTSTTSAATIAKIREVMGRFGSVNIIVSDNGAQFTSHEFDEFCKSEGICHIPTQPVHPQSNGQAERFVDTFKRALTKAKGEESVANVLQRFLQRYRITPNAQLPNNCTPAEIMLGRKMNSSLDLIKPKEKIELLRDTKMEMDFNVKHGAKERIFEPKQRVFVRDFRGGKTIWSPAEIIERIGSVIYTVGCDGMIWRRHANQSRVRYSDDVGDSDPTLSLLLDTFDIMDQPVQLPNDENPLPENDHSNQPNSPEITASADNVNNIPPNPNIGGRPQRNRKPPVRTNFSKTIGGRYEDS